LEKVNYKDSGVNIEAGENAVDRIKPIVKSTFNKNVLTNIGGFGGLYALDLKKWIEPILVSSVDGVGTKLIIAQKSGIFDTVGQDLVNHCVDDIFVMGATPQYFLDYIGVGKLEPKNIESIISGFAKACRENGLSLIGGEMAEMPGIYKKEDYDLAGTIVGLVEKKNIITGEKVMEGDVVIGFKSTGLHTNGYSLARNIIFEKLKYSVDTIIPNMNKTVAEAFLAIHKSYYPILKKWATPEKIHGMAHITGGGIPGNLKRSIPDGLVAEIDCSKWNTPELFKFLQKEGNVDSYEMYRAFNMGIGFIVMANEEIAEEILRETDGILIGKILKSENNQKVKLINI
jgi:phosphoribosylformylglycinamidine cyclo-ligase